MTTGQNRMTVLVNAVSIKEGGSLVVLERLIGGMSQLDPAARWHVIVDPRHIDLFGEHPYVRAHSFPWVGRSPAGLVWFYEAALPRLAMRTGADVVFSMTNYLSRRMLARPSLLLIQHAGHFSAHFAELTEAACRNSLERLAWRYKTGWVRASARCASLISVQTASMAQRVMTQATIPAERIRVISHGTGLTALAAEPRVAPRRQSWRIGYITKYGVQKNFPVVLKAVARLRSQGVDARLVLTLGGPPGSRESFERLRPLIAELGIGDAVENRGELEWTAIGPLYDSLDMFVFASTCESFGFPTVEAMARALPVVVADTRENLEVAGDGAVCFPPDDAEALASRLRLLMERPCDYERHSQRSLDRARMFSWRDTAAATLDLLRTLAERRQPETSTSASDAGRRARMAWGD